MKSNTDFVENILSLMYNDHNGYISFRELLNAVVMLSNGSLSVMRFYANTVVFYSNLNLIIRRDDTKRNVSKDRYFSLCNTYIAIIYHPYMLKIIIIL